MMRRNSNAACLCLTESIQLYSTAYSGNTHNKVEACVETLLYDLLYSVKGQQIIFVRLL